MWRRSATCALLVAACGERDVPVAAESAPPPAPVAIDAGVRQPVITSPHGGEIALVAITDDARAALTADDSGALRLWPSLDGTREPVVVHGHAPSELALVRTPDGFLAASLDAARGIELLAFAPDGALRGRQVVPAEPAYVELAASAHAILARRADQTIVRLDVPSALEPAPGEQILGIAARGDRAIAAIADPERPAELATIREISLAHGLAWGPRYTLPEPLVPPIALAPSGRRIAGVHARTGIGVVIELGGTSRVLTTDPVTSDGGERTLGFLDEDRVVFRGEVLVNVPAVTVVHDPWSGAPPSSRLQRGRNPVIAGGVSVGGIGTHLMIADGSETRFLGYRDIGIGYLRTTGSQITLGVGKRVLWLDDRLRERRSREVPSDLIGGLAVDDTHLLKATYAYLPDDRSQLELALFDAVGGGAASLGVYPQASNVVYEPGTGVYAVWGSTREVARAHLDLAARTSAPLRGLRTRGDATVELLDPAIAGAVAVAYAQDAANVVHVETFIDDRASNRPLVPASTVRIPFAAGPIGTDRTGAMYTLVSRPAMTVVVHRGGKEVRRVAVDRDTTSAAVDPAGTMLAASSRNEVVLHEIDGKQRWRVPAWSVNIARFTADGKTLLVNTQGGLMALDTMTGARTATGCGWGFGLSTTEPQLSIFIAPVVCAEAP